ncbi:MAG: Undecaprenyl-diphosphatase [Candidatus Gottesmanbacteria bacterium GW2011_GWA1_42_26]|nr:MAG: Undecaprenyl-diphosphatase [Candidatus Gottesmanbacteria bacterium GW2011_GWA1_42_26]
MELVKAILLGAVQGISEFLPISSTGHLIIAENLLGISQEKYGLSFDAALHLGTLIALLWFFRDDWKKLVLAAITKMSSSGLTGGSIKIDSRSPIGVEDKFRGNDIRGGNDNSQRLAFLLLIGTVPGVLFGLLLEKKVETVFRSPVLIALTLILFSGVLIYVEKVGKKIRDIKQMNWRDSLTVGLAQAVALIPAPIIAGAGGLKLIKTIGLFASGELAFSELTFFAVGIVSAAIFGYLTIKYFLRFVSKHSLYPFVVYRIILGILVLLLAFK